MNSFITTKLSELSDLGLFWHKNCPRTKLDRFRDNMAQFVSQNATIWQYNDYVQNLCQYKPKSDD